MIYKSPFIIILKNIVRNERLEQILKYFVPTFYIFIYNNDVHVIVKIFTHPPGYNLHNQSTY